MDLALYRKLHSEMYERLLPKYPILKRGLPVFYGYLKNRKYSFLEQDFLVLSLLAYMNAMMTHERLDSELLDSLGKKVQLLIWETERRMVRSDYHAEILVWREIFVTLRFGIDDRVGLEKLLRKTGYERYIHTYINVCSDLGENV